MNEMLQAIPTYSNAPGARPKGDNATAPEDASSFLQAFRPEEGESADPEVTDPLMALADAASGEGVDPQTVPDALTLAGNDALPPGMAVGASAAGEPVLRGKRAGTEGGEGLAVPQDGRGAGPGLPGAGIPSASTGKPAATVAARAVLAALAEPGRPGPLAGSGPDETATDLLPGRSVSAGQGRSEGQVPVTPPILPTVAQQRVTGAMVESRVSPDVDIARRPQAEVTRTIQTTPTGGVVIPPALLRAAAVQPVAPGLPAAVGEAQKIQMANLSGFAMAAVDGLPALGSAPLLLPPGAPPPGLFTDQAAMSQRVAVQIAQALSAAGSPTGVPVELALDPPELGRVRLNLMEINGVYALSIAVERPETADLMRRHIALLADEFARAGLDAPSVNISQDGGGGRSASRDEGAAHVVAALDGSVAVPAGPTAPQPSPYTSRGLDLRL